MLPVYESGNVTVSWYGLDLSTGWAEGTFLTVAPLDDRIGYKFSASGEMQVSKKPNKGALITMTFAQTAPILKEIANLAALQNAVGGLIPVAPFTIEDNTGGSTSMICNNAMLVTTAGVEFADEMGEREFTWVCETYIDSADSAAIIENIGDFLPT